MDALFVFREDDVEMKADSLSDLSPFKRLSPSYVIFFVFFARFSGTIVFVCIQITSDPYTGQTRTKKQLGGSYPGQRPAQQAPYTPTANAFDANTGTATGNFVAYGGGNALTLARPDGTALPPAMGMKPDKEYIQGKSLVALIAKPTLFYCLTILSLNGTT